MGIPGGYWGGYTGVLPTEHVCPRRTSDPSGAGPGRPRGPGVGGDLRFGRTGDGGGTQDHPAGPVGPMLDPPCPGSLVAASQPKGRDSMTFL